jgi:hypothetical protein
MRTIAEIMRRLATKQTVDQEAKDLLALIVFSLREISESVQDTIAAWEKRNYWVKAEHFRQKWAWAKTLEQDTSALVKQNAWDQIPALLPTLTEKINGILVKKYTRTNDLWQGAYGRLMTEQKQ